MKPVHYFNADDCRNCQQLSKYGVKKKLSRFVQRSPELAWNPLPNDELTRHIRTNKGGQPYVEKTFRTTEGERVLNQLDVDPYTPMLIFDGRRRLYEIDVVAVATGDDYPNATELDTALQDDVELTCRLLTRELFRLFLVDHGVDRETREIVLRERAAGTPFLVPEYEPGVYRTAEWHRAFDDALEVIYR